MSKPTTVAASVEKRDLAQRFATRFADYEPAQLAQHAECTKEAARLWLNAERCIDLTHALKLARSLPEGRFWLAQEMGEFDSAQLIDQLIRAAQHKS